MTTAYTQKGKTMAEYIMKSTANGWGAYVGELTRCKDCKHRPILTDRECDSGFKYEFPDERCPCQCDDPWYNWMPDDDWFCGNGERKEE